MACGQPQTSVKFQAVRRWVARSLGSVEHENRVVDLVSRLFRLTSAHHRLQFSDLRLLRLAAMVHDVGRSIDDDDHPALGADLLLQANHLPLSPDERRHLAYLTRYHRGAVPDVGRDQILRRTDDRERLALLLSILRAADALDSRSLASPELSFSLSGRRLRITCDLRVDSPKARRVFSRRKKFRLLEQILDLRVDVQIRVPADLRLVA